MPSETQTISFRVPAHIAGRLEKAGAEVVVKALSAPSLHDVVAGIHKLQETAKGIAKQSDVNGTAKPTPGSTDPGIGDISKKLDGIATSVSHLAESLAIGVTGLLVEAGKLEVDNAQKWVAHYLKTPHRERK